MLRWLPFVPVIIAARRPTVRKETMNPLSMSSFTLTTSLGTGLRAHVEALLARRSGLAPCTFESARLDTWVGQVPDERLAPLPPELAAYDCRNHRLVLLALAQDGFEDAVARARSRYGPGRIGVFLGTSTSGMLQTEIAYRRRDARTGALPEDFNYAGTHNNFSLGRFVQAHLGLAGPAVVISTACSSSAKVFASAARMIAAGVCDAAVVGGGDSLCLTTLYGFSSLELLSRAPCRPFDAERSGISIGEGAGFALLERAPAAEAPGTIRLLGIGESSDAHHMSTPHPTGLGARTAMQRALSSAGLAPGDIDYINLHGTATRTNDASEDLAVFDVFGANTPCSSTKGATGHLLGAAGITEALICAIAMREKFLPGSPNTQQPDPTLHVRYLLDNADEAPERAMSNSFGFGGSNCSLVLGRAH
jgi:3-oxoacyl-[acyl-carrier-protein] synthase-1